MSTVSYPWTLFDPSRWLNMPFGGNVAQNYHPLTTWFSPNIDIQYVGNSSVEHDVIANVAGYGSQLGTVIDVLEELTKGKEQTEAVKRLHDLWCKVGDIKASHKRSLLDAAKESLDKLAESDEQSLQSLIRQYAK